METKKKPLGRTHRNGSPTRRGTWRGGESFADQLDGEKRGNSADADRAERQQTPMQAVGDAGADRRNAGDGRGEKDEAANGHLGGLARLPVSFKRLGLDHETQHQFMLFGDLVIPPKRNRAARDVQSASEFRTVVAEQI